MQEPQDPTENLVKLATPLNLNDLVNNEGTTFELNFEDLQDQQEPEQLYYNNMEDLLNHTNPCSDLLDEDVYQDGEPFENLAKKMVNLLGSGAVKKRILREGYGDVVPEKSLVTVDYNAYVEYNDEPFDSTYLRKKPHTFRLEDGAVVPGLEIGVKSMKLNEQAQFLVQPEYAYGKIGCLQRIPPNATILYEVELKNVVDSGAAISYPNLPETQQNEFEEIYKYTLALCSKGNDLFAKNLIRQAIKEYNIAVSKLERATLKDYDDQEKQQRLLLRLFTNLVVSFTKLQEPRRACINCNKIYSMCKGTILKVPAKVYFNHGRCLILLNDFEWAERKLKQAQRMEPQNKAITDELIKLDAKKKESYNREVALAKAIFKNNEINKEPHDTEEVTKEFCGSLTQYCQELLADNLSTQYNLPGNLTDNELDFCRQEVAKFGLELKCSVQNGIDKFFIIKPSSVKKD